VDAVEYLRAFDVFIMTSHHEALQHIMEAMLYESACDRRGR
jgi:hypothetical protein